MTPVAPHAEAPICKTCFSAASSGLQKKNCDILPVQILVNTGSVTPEEINGWINIETIPILYRDIWIVSDITKFTINRTDNHKFVFINHYIFAVSHMSSKFVNEYLLYLPIYQILS